MCWGIYVQPEEGVYYLVNIFIQEAGKEVRVCEPRRLTYHRRSLCFRRMHNVRTAVS